MKAMKAALGPHAFDTLFQFADARSDAAPVILELLLTRSACADAAAETRQHGPATRQPRQEIVQLRQLHLQLPFAAARPASKNVEDELRAVDNPQVERLFEIAKL